MVSLPSLTVVLVRWLNVMTDCDHGDCDHGDCVATLHASGPDSPLSVQPLAVNFVVVVLHTNILFTALFQLFVLLVLAVCVMTMCEHGGAPRCGRVPVALKCTSTNQGVVQYRYCTTPWYKSPSTVVASEIRHLA